MGYYFGPVAIDDLTPEAIAKIRQGAIDKALAAFLCLRIRCDLLPIRARLALERAYYQKYLVKPVEELTDDDFLSVRNIGPKSLAAIRRLLPAPESK